MRPTDTGGKLGLVNAAKVRVQSLKFTRFPSWALNVEDALVPPARQ